MPSSNSEASTAPVVRLPYRAPFDWPALLAFYRARAIDGLEIVAGDRYRRVVSSAHGPALLELGPGPGHSLEARITGLPAAAVPVLLAQLRRVLDLDTDTAPIRAHLARDAILAPLVAAWPGLRVAGAIDPFEQAVRAILGQQVSIVAARNLAARLCQHWGAPVHFAAAAQLRYAFPTPLSLREADVASLGMPRARGRAVSALAAAVLEQPDLLRGGAGLEHAVARLEAVRGIGPWSAHYIAMRALREADAFPASDVGLLRALTGDDGLRPSAAAATARAQSWRPWRAYAAQYLWTGDARTSASRD